MRTLVTSKPTESVKRFYPERITAETQEEMEFETFDQLVDFGQKNSENQVLTIKTLRRDGSTREIHGFINFKP